MSALPSGNIPLISAKKFNNGLKKFVRVSPSRLKSANTITWNKDGDGGAGLAYFQPFKYAVDSHVFVLYPKKSNISTAAMLFIIPILSKYKSIFGHGLANNNNRFNTLKIMLPVDQQDNPDWQFMEDYIKSLPNANLL